MHLPRLKEWRLRRAMGQRDLSEASGVGASTINRIERGLQLARPSTTRRLAEALAVRPDDLMEDFSGTPDDLRPLRSNLDRFTSSGEGITVQYPGGAPFKWVPHEPEPDGSLPVAGEALPPLTDEQRREYRETFGVDPEGGEPQ